MKQLLDYIIPNIVDHPEAVVITENDTPSGLVLSIQVHPDDMGRVIGKSGKVIKAIRQIARIIAIKQGVRAHIDVVDKNNPDHKVSDQGFDGETGEQMEIDAGQHMEQSGEIQEQASGEAQVEETVPETLPEEQETV